jgi:LPS-assembly lipoprotein
LSESRPLANRLWGLLAAGLSAGGCGFHLQDALSLPPVMQRTHLRAVNTHSQFYRELRRELEDLGVELVDTPAAAGAVIDIFVDETDQRVLSVSARNVPTEYEVYYTVRYGIAQGSEVVVPAQDLTLTRDYTYDSTLVLGKAHEEDVLRASIVEDLVRIVLEQASAR